MDKEQRIKDIAQFLYEKYTVAGAKSMPGWAAIRESLRDRLMDDARQINALFPQGDDRPRIICLCGSSRFIESFAVLAWEFEKEGNITLGLHYLPPSYCREHIPDHLAEHEGVAKRMDELHLRKIDLADEVFVLNVGGYIGESTANEIAYATKLGKPIKYLEVVNG